MSTHASAPSSRQYLVTGAGSGIGLAIVETLAQAGHRVWAGARREEDLARLAAMPGVEALPLDLLSPASATAARDVLAAHGGRLDGLVNNAGIGEIGHLAAWRDDDVRRLFETNVFGLMRLTQALLPMLLAARGRVVNIGSMGGTINQPLFGPYTMSKHALEAYSETLRMEAAPHGLAVSIVQPGAVTTRIRESASAGTAARLAATPAPFDAEARRALEGLGTLPVSQPDAPESATNRRPASPASVAAVVVEALSSAAPQARYLVCTRWEGGLVLDALTERLIDAATSPGLGLDRTALLARIDAAWRVRGPDRI